jgi:hypothetical protein
VLEGEKPVDLPSSTSRPARALGLTTAPTLHARLASVIE